MKSHSPRFLLSRTVKVYALLGVCGALGFMACARPPSPFSSLLNHGMIPVSAENPYVGSNLFLAKEMEKSTYLYNFFKANGAPEAIELTGDDESTMEVRFFYAKRKEMFVAHPHEDKESASKEWIVRGPYAVDRTNFREVSKLPYNDVAVFEIWGRKERFGESVQPAVSRELVPVFVPTPTPRPTPRPKPKKVIKIVDTPTPIPAPINFDQKALMDAKGLAERAPNGDLIHTVRDPAETLQSISTWYTGSAENAPKVAEKNGLAPDAKFNPGSRVLVPSALIKNPNTMK